MASQKIRHEERCHVVVPLRCERFVAGIKGEAVRAGYSFDAMFFTDAIKHSACAAIGIADEDAL